MDKYDKEQAYQLQDLWVALGLLTRLPLPARDWDDARPAALAAWAYPLVGLVVGAIAACVAYCAHKFGAPAMVTAGLALTAMIVITGAMHEDGLADSADGLWGGNSAERRLEIMKDSHIGAYGVIALILGLGLRWAALSALIAGGAIFAPLIAAAIISRSAMAYVMDIMPNARETGLSHMTGRPGKPATRITAGIAAVAALVGFGWSGLWLIAVAGLAILACAQIAQRKIAGQTGDILGATQQVTEIALLIAMTLAQ